MTAQDSLLDMLQRQHPEFTHKSSIWRQYRLLYEGGHKFNAAADELLHKRRSEPGDVYGERLSRVFYENYIGACIDWYAATIFRRPPSILISTEDATTEQFYREFLSDCDQCGLGLAELAKRQFVELLVCGRTHAMIDFPARTVTPRSRAHEEELGQSRAYIVPLSADSITDWRRRSDGDYDWLIVASNEEYRTSFDADQLTQLKQWLVLDRKNYSRYEAHANSGDSRTLDRVVTLTSEGPHALSDAGRLPIVTWELNDGLWLADRAAGLQIEHFNKSNALAWALHLGLFAMPVVYSERDWNQILGEAYYIQLGSGDRFGWTEPEGKVFAIAAQNLERLRNEIYRVCYLINQSAGQQPTRIAQSGLSKSMDFAVTLEVLKSYANSIKSYLRRILAAVAEARGDRIEVTISGLDRFDESDIRPEIETVRALDSLGLPSTSLRMEAQRRIAAEYLTDSDPAVLAKVVEELTRANEGSRHETV